MGPGSYVLPGGQTISAGGAPVTISGTTYSAAPSGGIVANGQTITPAGQAGASPGITAGGQVLPVASGLASAIVISGRTLLPGGSPITVTENGQVETLSLPANSNGQAIVVNGRTTSLSPGATVLTGANGEQITISRTAAGEVIIGGKTLVPGGIALVTNGVTITEKPDGEIIEISGAVTSTIGSAGDGGIGGFINSGLGGSATGQARSSSVPTAFPGAATRLRMPGLITQGIGLGILGTVVLLL